MSKKAKKKIKPKKVESISVEKVKNFWDSKEAKLLRKELNDAKQKSIEKSFFWYNNLSDEEKYLTVQGLLYIILKAEKEGCSHRQLQSELGIYPEGFWIDELIDIHNILYNHFYPKQDSPKLLQDIEQIKRNS